MAVKKKKKKTITQHKKRIDLLFHEYIRRRDADNETGYCKCISCSKIIHYTESDGGHFLSRKAMSTRWDERNVNAQCRKCNRFENGNQYAYSLKLGAELADELLQKSRETFKLMDFEYEEIYQEYKAKLKELKEIQNF